MARAVWEPSAGLLRRAAEERILAAAVALFAGQGLDATAVRQVVDRAQVTKGALDHYFDSKDDLLYELCHALNGVRTAEIEDIVARGLDPATTVREIHQLPVWYRPDGPKTAGQLANDVADFVLAALFGVK
jgi:AcrR family transcriptional regulator